MSFIVQPAPLITNDPVSIRLSMPKSGRHPGAAANATLQLQGQKSNHVPVAMDCQKIYYLNFNLIYEMFYILKKGEFIPIGRSNLINLRYG